MVFMMAILSMMTMFSPGRGRYNEQRHHVVLCRKLAQPRPQGLKRILNFGGFTNVNNWLTQ